MHARRVLFDPGWVNCVRDGPINRRMEATFTKNVRFWIRANHRASECVSDPDQPLQSHMGNGLRRTDQTLLGYPMR